MELTPEETSLVGDARTLLAKGHAMRVIRGHLEHLREVLGARVRAECGTWEIPPGFDPDQAQVARGEDLGGTPYQYLDCPRHFNRETYFSFRTLVWWGRSLNCCWVFKGERLDAVRRRLGDGVVDTPGVGIWFGGDPWDWEDFVPLSAVSWEALAHLEFLKIGTRHPLDAEHLTRDCMAATALATFEAVVPLIERP